MYKTEYEHIIVNTGALLFFIIVLAIIVITIKEASQYLKK